MWYSREIGRQKFAIKCALVGEPDSYKIWLSDLVRIWVESFTSEDLVNRCKEMNPYVEAKSERIVAKSLALLESEIADFTLNTHEQGDARTLLVSSKLASVPFRIMFNLQLEKPQEIYEEVTLPLLMLVQDLQAKQMLLINQIKQKDIEINEYKLEGARLSRGNLSDPFDEQEFPQGSSKNATQWNETTEPMHIFTKSAESFSSMMKKQPSATLGTSLAGMSQESDDQYELPERDLPEQKPVKEDPTETRHRYLALEKEKKLVKRQKLSKRKPALRL